jgi:hypothetical protein
MRKARKLVAHSVLAPTVADDLHEDCDESWPVRKKQWLRTSGWILGAMAGILLWERGAINVDLFLQPSV